MAKRHADDETACHHGVLTAERPHYGANYARLTRVKAAYDPDRVFTFPRAV